LPQAEVRGLRDELGLGGESTDPLAKASELRKLQERVEAELAEARADIKHSNERLGALAAEADEGAKRVAATHLQDEAEAAEKEVEAGAGVRTESKARAEAQEEAGEEAVTPGRLLDDQSG